MKNIFIIGLFLTSLLQGAASSEMVPSSVSELQQAVHSLILSGNLKQTCFNPEKALASASRIVHNEDMKIAREAWKQDRITLAAAIKLNLMNPKFRTAFCPSPLYTAISLKDYGLTSFLLCSSVPITTARGPIGHSKDIFNACNNSTKTFAFVLAFVADIDAPINKKKETLLHKAVLKPNRNFMRYLLFKGANVNVQDHRGCTPLHTLVATSCITDSDEAIDSTEVLVRTELLLKAKADLNLRTTSGKSVQELAHLCRSRSTGAKLDKYFKTVKPSPLILQQDSSA